MLGTLRAHFMYRWSGGALLAGVFCAVNESVSGTHEAAAFFPVFLFTAVQFCVGERDGLLAARAVSVTAGLALIPTLYYTYTGIWGDHTLWADAAIFYLSAAVTFLDGRSASPSAAALEDGMPGGGTGVAVGAGISVCLVDLFTAPHRPVPGPSGGTIRDTVKKTALSFWDSAVSVISCRSGNRSNPRRSPMSGCGGNRPFFRSPKA